jgi:hypothetical protein
VAANGLSQATVPAPEGADDTTNLPLGFIVMRPSARRAMLTRAIDTRDFF